jgi:hypothetical protein
MNYGHHSPLMGLWSSDTTLIPPRTQYGATHGKQEQGTPLIYAGIAGPSTPLQHVTDHS